MCAHNRVQHILCVHFFLVLSYSERENPSLQPYWIVQTTAVPWLFSSFASSGFGDMMVPLFAMVDAGILFWFIDCIKNMPVRSVPF